MMPYFKSNNNSTSQITTTNNNTPIKLPQFDNTDTKDHYLAPQNYRYLSFLPGFSTYTHGLPIASVNTAPNQIAAKEQIILNLKVLCNKFLKNKKTTKEKKILSNNNNTTTNSINMNIIFNLVSTPISLIYLTPMTRKYP